MDPLTLIGGLTGIFGKVIDKIWPDPTQAAQAKLALLEAQQKGDLAELDADLKLALGQIEVNKIEAASPSIFVSGARPALLWVCVIGLAYSWVIQPLGSWVAVVAWHFTGTFPTLDTISMIGLASGLAGLRTVDRLKGVAREQGVAEMPSYQPTAKGAK
jgi:hypothetical protein